MFPHTYFPNQYFLGNYWYPVEGVQPGPPHGGGMPEGVGVSVSSSAMVPNVFEVQEILRRIREQQKQHLTEDEDALLLLLLSEQFGGIGKTPAPIVHTEDDEEALLLALASNTYGNH